MTDLFFPTSKSLKFKFLNRNAPVRGLFSAFLYKYPRMLFFSGRKKTVIMQMRVATDQTCRVCSLTNGNGCSSSCFKIRWQFPDTSSGYLPCQACQGLWVKQERYWAVSAHQKRSWMWAKVRPQSIKHFYLSFGQVLNAYCGREYIRTKVACTCLTSRKAKASRDSHENAYSTEPWPCATDSKHNTNSIRQKDWNAHFFRYFKCVYNHIWSKFWPDSDWWSNSECGNRLISKQ